MALLQISEPGMAPAPHQRRLAVGIDLGTTNSLVAAVRNGVAEVLPDDEGRALLPSVVRYLEKGGRRIGYAAKEAAASDPRNTIVSVKRFMGRGKAEVEGAANAPYDFVDAPGMVQIRTIDGVKSPVEVSAEILATLRQRAEDTLGDELVGAVITVPAYFDDAQRQATKDAARLAGLNVLRLLNEPTAAAIAYGLDNGAEGLYAVYDLGGGTFDMSILHLTKGVFEVLATGGDSALGGDDFDHALFAHVLAAAGIERAALSAEDVRALLDRSRAVKEALSDAPEAAFEMTLSTGATIAQTISAETFDELVEPLVQRTLAPTRKALRDAQVTPAEIKGVVLVGGATRMPVIRAAVERILRPAAADQSRSGPGGRARRGHPGRCPGRQQARRRLAAAGRDPAVARPGNHGRAGGEGHSAQHHHPGGARAGVHHLQGRPDRDGDPRGAGRARAGGRLPFAGALRAARHSADGGRRGANPRDLPGRRRRPAVGVRARAAFGRGGLGGGQAVLRPGRRRHREDAGRQLQDRRHRHARARCARRRSRRNASPRRPRRRSRWTRTCSTPRSARRSTR